MVPELELADTAVSYPGPVPVHALRPVRLRIDTGEMIAVVGRSGSGKSTLLNVLGLLDHPSAGRYLVRGIDTGMLTESARTALRARQFGFIFQAYHLLKDRTATENAELGLLYRNTRRQDRRARATAALEKVGLGHRMDALPGTLSGGEQQRVSIARALAQEPRVLLCDEPTGNLDKRNSDLIIGLLTQLNSSGLTVVVVTHDVRMAAAMPRCLRIDDGTMSEAAADRSAVS
jgi:putative ABC transport system ATP-binding protein